MVRSRQVALAIGAGFATGVLRWWQRRYGGEGPFLVGQPSPEPPPAQDYAQDYPGGPVIEPGLFARMAKERSNGSGVDAPALDTVRFPEIRDPLTRVVSILRLPLNAQLKDYADQAQRADLVIDGKGHVLKDRYGVEKSSPDRDESHPRPARPFPTNTVEVDGGITLSSRDDGSVVFERSAERGAARHTVEVAIPNQHWAEFVDAVLSVRPAVATSDIAE